MRIFSKKQPGGDAIFKIAVMAAGGLVVALVLLMFLGMIGESMPAIKKFGFRFIFNSIWDPVAEDFGAWTFIYGTLVSSFLGLLIAVPLSLGVAIYLSEMAKDRVRTVLSFMVELLSAIPSVIYGLWGIFVLAPLLRLYVEPFLAKYFGYVPLFQGEFYGVGMLAAGIILGIMVIPTISSVCREIFLAVPSTQREAVLALGATKWETIKLAVLFNSKTGIAGAVILGLGRAIGETMAVTMLIGNRPEISASLFAPAHTMASVIANEFTEATTDLYAATLVEIGLVLFILTFFINLAARLLIWKVTFRKAV